MLNYVSSNGQLVCSNCCVCADNMILFTWQESTSQLLRKFECVYSPNTPYLPYWSSDLWILNTECASCLNASKKWAIWQSGFITNCSSPCSHRQSVSIHTWIFYILCCSIVGNQRRFLLLMSRFELYYLQMDVLWKFSNVLHGVLLFPFPLNPVYCVCYYLGSWCPWQLLQFWVYYDLSFRESSKCNWLP